MKIIDANLLMYAYDDVSPFHVASKTWIESAFSSSEPIGLPLPSVAAFLRIMTHKHLAGQRYSLREAIEFVDEWLALPHVRLLAPGENHWPILRRTLLEGEASGPLSTDAQIAALTIEIGGTLYSNDRDFARFPGLRWQNPLDA